MSTVLSNVAASDQFQRYQAIQRKNAENAYTRTVQYNGKNQKTVADLEDLLLGKTEEPTVVQKETSVNPDPSQVRDVPQLGAGQVKQVSLPIGKTLEETIDSWRSIRAEAISEPEPTTADYLLAAKASAVIMRTEAQIALHNLAKRIRESGTDSMSLSSKDARQATQRQLLFDKAASTYSFQNEMKQAGFQVGWPDFYKSA